MTSRLKDWVLKLVIVLGAAFWLVLIAMTWVEGDAAADETPAVNRAPASGQSTGGDDEYGFKWLDPEKKIYVLQNRKYLKASRLMLSATAGTSFSNPYRMSFNVDPRVAYFLSEDWGIEGFYSFVFNVPNSTYQALGNTGLGIIPGDKEVRAEYGALISWVPWYAKINVFNKIIYFDWYFEGGAGGIQIAANQSAANATANYLVTTSLAGFLGTGHMFHISSDLTVRLDFLGAFYSAPITPSQGSAIYSDYKISLGLGWRL